MGRGENEEGLYIERKREDFKGKSNGVLPWKVLSKIQGDAVMAY